MPRAQDKKLRDEYQNGESVKPFAYDHKDVFAIPFRFDEENADYVVLWSMFSASKSLWHGPAGPQLHIRDLRELIKENDDQGLKNVVEETFTTLRNLHMPFGKHRVERRRIGEEYDWYRRDFPNAWGSEWMELWGDQRTTEVDGVKRVNPLWVFNQLGNHEADLTVGAIHGDLHPGNIVVAEGNHPRIIDFGWSGDSGHIAKDYVLLECNLRFVTLRPQVSLQESEILAKWIEFGKPAPAGLRPYLDRRCKLIDHLRKQARSSFPEDVNWDWEYIVPLFMVAFGLLRFAGQLGNQVAAMHTVLALAERVDRLIG